MASSTPRKPRVSRKGDVPANFILKWQSFGPKPLVRRPMTACQACRAAKVKCDNKPQCDRCNSRDIVCRYTHVVTPPPSDVSPAPDVASPIAPTQASPEEIAIDSDTTDATHRLSMDTTAYDGAFEAMADWTPGAGQQALDDFAIAWPPMDTNLNATPLFETDFSSVTTMVPTNGLSQPNPLFSLPPCQCRESLVTLVPRVNTAMQGQHLDDVFKRMQSVVEGFQGIVHCTECNITCVDLICIMAVFQQTGAGFEYIAKADLSSAISMTFGGCEVPINDPKLRAMLVLSLIHQATAVLDALRAKGQQMLRSLCTPSAMAQANIGHLDTVIADFRNVLRRIADTADKAASPPQQAASTFFNSDSRGSDLLV